MSTLDNSKYSDNHEYDTFRIRNVSKRENNEQSSKLTIYGKYMNETSSGR